MPLWDVSTTGEPAALQETLSTLSSTARSLVLGEGGTVVSCGCGCMTDEYSDHD